MDRWRRRWSPSSCIGEIQIQKELPNIEDRICQNYKIEAQPAWLLHFKSTLFFLLCFSNLVFSGTDLTLLGVSVWKEVPMLTVDLHWKFSGWVEMSNVKCFQEIWSWVEMSNTKNHLSQSQPFSRSVFPPWTWPWIAAFISQKRPKTPNSWHPAFCQFNIILMSISERPTTQNSWCSAQCWSNVA